MRPVFGQRLTWDKRPHRGAARNAGATSRFSGEGVASRASIPVFRLGGTGRPARRAASLPQRLLLVAAWPVLASPLPAPPPVSLVQVAPNWIPSGMGIGVHALRNVAGEL